MNRPLILLAAVCPLLFACGCSSPAQRAGRYSAQATAAMRSGRFAAAIIELRNAVRLEPGSVDLHARLAHAYAADQQFGAALSEYTQALNLRPDNPPVQLAAGRILAAANRLNQARAAASSVLAKHPGNGQAAILLASVLIRQKQYPEALKLLRAWVQKQPRFPPGFLALGTAELAGGDPIAARHAWDQALTLDPNSIAARRNLAALDLLQHQPDAAERELLAAVAANPKSGAAERALAGFYASQHHPKRAEAALRSVIRLDHGSPASQFALASFLLSQRQIAQAQTIDAALARSAPDFLPARMQRIEIAMSQRRYARARALADALVQQHPHQAPARLLRARVELAQADSKNALADLTAARQLDPALPGLNDLTGQAYTQLSRPMQAISAYQLSLRSHPHDAMAAAAMAQLLLAQGHPNQALNYASQASVWAPGLAAAWLARGDAEAALHQDGTAAQDWNQAERLAPNQPQAAVRLGGLYLRERKYGPADAAFRRALGLAPGEPAALSGLASVLLAQGQGAAALQLVRGQIRRHETAPLDELLANVELHQQHPGAAEAALQRAVSLAPNSLAPYLELASLQIREHHLRQAEAEYAAAIQRQPHNAGLWTMLGILSEQDGKNAEAQHDYQQALAIAPDSGVANNNLAYLYAQQDRDLSQALVLAQRALHSLPNAPTVADTLATVYLKLHLYASAVPLLRQAVRQQPRNAMFHFHLAAALLGNGHKQQARAELSAALRLDAALRRRPEAARILAAR